MQNINELMEILGFLTVLPLGWYFGAMLSEWKRKIEAKADLAEMEAQKFDRDFGMDYYGEGK